MHIWTSSPNEEIWRQLRYLTSIANVENVLLGKTKSGRSAHWTATEALKAAPEISACLRQADEYFIAAESVRLPTKPLLLFYGTHALSKAAILANDPSLELQDLNYHGLSTRPSTTTEPAQTTLRAYAKDPSLWSMEEEFAVSNNGVFPHLSRIYGDVEITPGRIFRFKDVVRVIPDLSDIFARHYGESSHCIYLYSGPNVWDDNRLHVYFSVKTHDEIISVFPEFQSGFEPVFMHESFPGYRKADSASIEFATLEKGAIAGRYFVRPLDSGIHKSTPVLFVAMFILSNLVRYKPAFWMDVIEGRSSGSVSIAEALCNVFERRFPNDVLNMIWHESFTFGTPGYLS